MSEVDNIILFDTVSLREVIDKGISASFPCAAGVQTLAVLASGCTVQESHSAHPTDTLPDEVAGDGSARLNSTGCCCPTRSSRSVCLAGRGKVGMAARAHPMCWSVSDGHTGTAMVAEGCPLQCGLALQPFLIWLRVRDGN